MTYICGACGNEMDVRDDTVYELHPMYLSLDEVEDSVHMYFCRECAHQMETVINER